MSMRSWSAIALLGLLTAGGACAYLPGLGVVPPQPPFYCAPPLTLRVVDASTGQPLAGVIAVAHWELEEPVSTGVVGELAVEEDVSDDQGQLSFPGWGPRFRPLVGVLWYRAPTIVFFREGYYSTSVENKGYGPGRASRLGIRRRSQWNGKVVELDPIEGGDTEHLKNLEWLQAIGIPFVIGPWCGWKHMPKMLRAFSDEVVQLRAKGTRGARDLYTLDDWAEGNNSMYRDECGVFDLQHAEDAP